MSACRAYCRRRRGDLTSKGSCNEALLAQTVFLACGLGAAAQPAPAPRDGQHDFDFEIGVWKTHLSRLLHPLTTASTRRSCS
jgi:hypothetical protein